MGSRDSYAIRQKCALKPPLFAVAGAVSVYHLDFFFPYSLPFLLLQCCALLLLQAQAKCSFGIWIISQIGRGRKLGSMLMFINVQLKQTPWLACCTMQSDICSLWLRWGVSWGLPRVFQHQPSPDWSGKAASKFTAPLNSFCSHGLQLQVNLVSCCPYLSVLRVGLVAC